MLPAALPSLVVSLTAVSHGYANNSLRNKLYAALDCGVTSGVGQYARGGGGADSDLRGGSFLDLDSDPFLWDQFSRCMFPGSQFYRMLYRWHTLEKEVNEYLTSTKTKKGKQYYTRSGEKRSIAAQ
jgi:hexosaminidase